MSGPGVALPPGGGYGGDGRDDARLVGERDDRYGSDPESDEEDDVVGGVDPREVDFQGDEWLHGDPAQQGEGEDPPLDVTNAAAVDAQGIAFTIACKDAWYIIGMLIYSLFQGLLIFPFVLVFVEVMAVIIWLKEILRLPLRGLIAICVSRRVGLVVRLLMLLFAVPAWIGLLVVFLLLGILVSAIDAFAIPTLANYSQGKQQVCSEAMHYVFFVIGGVTASFHEVERHVFTLFRFMTDPDAEQRERIQKDPLARRKRMDVYAFIEWFADQTYEGEPFELRIPHLIISIIFGAIASVFTTVYYTVVAVIALPGLIYRGYARVMHDPENYGVTRAQMRKQPWRFPLAFLATLLWPVVATLVVVLAPLYGLLKGVQSGYIVYHTSNPMWVGDEVLCRTRFTAEEFDLPYPRAQNEDSDTDEGITDDDDDLKTPGVDAEGFAPEDISSSSDNMSDDEDEEESKEEADEEAGIGKKDDLSKGAGGLGSDVPLKRSKSKSAARKRSRLTRAEWTAQKQKTGKPLPRGLYAGFYALWKGVVGYTGGVVRTVLDQPPNTPLSLPDSCHMLCSRRACDDPNVWKAAFVALILAPIALVLGLLFAVFEIAIFSIPVLVRSYMKVVHDLHPHTPQCTCKRAGSCANWARVLLVAWPMFFLLLIVLPIPHVLFAVAVLLGCPFLLPLATAHAAFDKPHVACGVAVRGMLRKMRAWDRAVVRYVWDMSDEVIPGSMIWDGCFLEEDDDIDPTTQAMLQARAKKARDVSRVRRWMHRRGERDEAIISHVHRAIFEKDMDAVKSDPYMLGLTRLILQPPHLGGLEAEPKPRMASPHASKYDASNPGVPRGNLPVSFRQSRRRMARPSPGQSLYSPSTIAIGAAKPDVETGEVGEEGKQDAGVAGAGALAGESPASPTADAGATAPMLPPGEEDGKPEEPARSTNCCAACFGGMEAFVPGLADRRRRREERHARREALREERRKERERKRAELEARLERRRKRREERLAREAAQGQAQAPDGTQDTQDGQAATSATAEGEGEGESGGSSGAGSGGSEAGKSVESGSRGGVEEHAGMATVHEEDEEDEGDDKAGNSPPAAMSDTATEPQSAAIVAEVVGLASGMDDVGDAPAPSSMAGSSVASMEQSHPIHRPSVAESVAASVVHMSDTHFQGGSSRDATTTEDSPTSSDQGNEEAHAGMILEDDVSDDDGDDDDDEEEGEEEVARGRGSGEGVAGGERERRDRKDPLPWEDQDVDEAPRKPPTSARTFHASSSSSSSSSSDPADAAIAAAMAVSASLSRARTGRRGKKSGE